MKEYYGETKLLEINKYLSQSNCLSEIVMSG